MRAASAGRGLAVELDLDGSCTCRPSRPRQSVGVTATGERPRRAWTGRSRAWRVRGDRLRSETSWPASPSGMRQPLADAPSELAGDHRHIAYKRSHHVLAPSGIDRGGAKKPSETDLVHQRTVKKLSASRSGPANQGEWSHSRAVPMIGGGRGEAARAGNRSRGASQLQLSASPAAAARRVPVASAPAASGPRLPRR